MIDRENRRVSRSKSIRQKSLTVLMLCAVNISGCNNGKMRTVQRPRFMGNPFRRQAIVVNPGIETVQTPGSVVVEQQGGVTATTESGEPPVTTLQPRQGSGAVTSVVPSFDDAQQPLGSGPRTSIDATRPGASPSDAKSIMNSLAPPAEAPQVIMEAPPIGAGSSGRSGLSAPIDSSTNRAAGGQTNEEPRLEAIEPRKPSGSGTTPPADKTKENGTPKSTSWRTPKFGDVTSRSTYQASTKRTVASDGNSIGVID
jgi:hypothetical protein